jgi:hypothetical protein
MPPVVDEAIHVVDRTARSATVALSVRYSGAVAVKFLFQHVAPGAYIRRTDAAYEQRWTAVAGNDDGRNGDRVANDGIYSALCPVDMLVPRSIVRWRAQVDYAGGTPLVLPANADVPNFVFYFYYASVPPFRAAIDPSGSGAQATVESFALADAEPMAIMHVIADEQDVWNGQFMYKANITTAPDDSGYQLLATVVVDDEVYDHVRWRCRGANGRFAYGKNAWKFQLNDGHFMRLRQDGARGGAIPGRRLETVNIDSLFLNLMSGWEREYEPIGTHGLPQLMSARLFELNQLPSLDVVGRVDQSDGDDLVRGFDTSFTIDDLSRQKKRWLWASARVHFLERAMCSASYIHRGELEGFSLKNDVLMAMCQYDL